MARGDRKCLLCGSEYNFCSTRADNEKKSETWRNLYCSEDCKSLFNILSSYNFGHISESKAKDRLVKLNYSKLNSIDSSYRNLIDKIMKSESASDVGNSQILTTAKDEASSGSNFNMENSSVVIGKHKNKGGFYSSDNKKK